MTISRRVFSFKVAHFTQDWIFRDSHNEKLEAFRIIPFLFYSVFLDFSFLLLVLTVFSFSFLLLIGWLDLCCSIIEVTTPYQ